MPTVRDTARIRDITSKSIELDVPNVDDPEALEADAKLVWERLINVNITPNCLERKRNGQPGRIWRGRILAENFYKLWPRLADRVVVPKAEGERLTGAVMSYLKQCGMLHCLETTTKHNAAVWWVADHWQPLRISHVADEAPVEDAVAESEPEPEPTEDGEFKCRLCDHRFDLTSARGGHEYRSHRAVVGADGKVYQYNAADYTPKYMGDCVMRVLEKAEKPLSFNAIAGGCYEYDPRLGKPVVRRLLMELIAAGAVREVKKGVHPLYELDKGTASVTPAPAEGTVSSINSGFVNDLTKLPASAMMAPPVAAAGDLPATVAYAEHVISTALGCLRSVQESLQSMPQQLDEMRDLLAEKDRTIEALRTKLIHKAASSPETEAKLKAALEELEKVKIERDGYKASVEAFRAALSGIVKD